MTVQTVALLGTGTMGTGMARNIAAAGLTLKVWNPHQRAGRAAGRRRPGLRHGRSGRA